MSSSTNKIPKRVLIMETDWKSFSQTLCRCAPHTWSGRDAVSTGSSFHDRALAHVVFGTGSGDPWSLPWSCLMIWCPPVVHLGQEGCWLVQSMSPTCRECWRAACHVEPSIEWCRQTIFLMLVSCMQWSDCVPPGFSPVMQQFWAQVMNMVWPY